MRRRVAVGAVAALVLLGLWLWMRGPRPTAGGGAARGPAAAAPTSRRGADFAPAVRASRSALGAPRATITGRVTEPGGRPIAGALVCAQGTAPDLSEAELRDPACVASGADGTYRLTNLYAAVWEVDASAAGHHPAGFARAGARTSSWRRGRSAPASI